MRGLLFLNLNMKQASLMRFAAKGPANKEAKVTAEVKVSEAKLHEALLSQSSVDRVTRSK